MEHSDSHEVLTGPPMLLTDETHVGMNQAVLTGPPMLLTEETGDRLRLDQAVQGLVTLEWHSPHEQDPHYFEHPQSGIPRKRKRTVDGVAGVVRTRKRRPRCKECEPCRLPDCGECVNCRDKKKYGGPSRRNKSCTRRRCEKLRKKAKDATSPSLDDTITGLDDTVELYSSSDSECNETTNGQVVVKLEENAHGNEGFPGSSSGRGSEERGGPESDFAGLDEGAQEEVELHVARGAGAHHGESASARVNGDGELETTNLGIKERLANRANPETSNRQGSTDLFALGQVYFQEGISKLYEAIEQKNKDLREKDGTILQQAKNIQEMEKEIHSLRNEKRQDVSKMTEALREAKRKGLEIHRELEDMKGKIRTWLESIPIL